MTSRPSFAPVPVRARRDGWTPERQLRFIAELGGGRCVAQAAKAVGLSRESAYHLRRRADARAFAAAWDAALADPATSAADWEAFERLFQWRP